VCCPIAGSNYYHQSCSRDEALLTAAIVRLAAAWSTYGYRRITALLHREQLQVNRKHVARLMRAMGLPRQRPARRPRKPDSAHPYPRYPNLGPHLESTPPNHVWVGDMTTSVYKGSSCT
jgi:putative transposase